MPVSFYVDPDIMNDQEAKFVNSITLSYTFYEIDMPEEKVALNWVSPYVDVINDQNIFQC